MWSCAREHLFHSPVAAKQKTNKKRPSRQDLPPLDSETAWPRRGASCTRPVDPAKTEILNLFGLQTHKTCDFFENLASGVSKTFRELERNMHKTSPKPALSLEANACHLVSRLRYIKCVCIPVVSQLHMLLAETHHKVQKSLWLPFWVDMHHPLFSSVRDWNAQEGKQTQQLPKQSSPGASPSIRKQRTNTGRTPTTCGLACAIRIAIRIAGFRESGRPARGRTTGRPGDGPPGRWP